MSLEKVVFIIFIWSKKISGPSQLVKLDETASLNLTTLYGRRGQMAALVVLLQIGV